jgi:hypothetical protein
MSKQKPLDEILAGWDGLERPADGDIYKHYKGGLFEIVATGFLEDSETPCVIYRSLEKKVVWVRTAKNFLEQVEHDGQTTQRFSKAK